MYERSVTFFALAMTVPSGPLVSVVLFLQFYLCICTLLVLILSQSFPLLTSLISSVFFQPSQLTARQRALGGEDGGILSQVVQIKIANLSKEFLCCL